MMIVSQLDATRPDDIEQYRSVRLRALQLNPEAFSSTFEREATFDDATWAGRVSGFADRPGAVFVISTDDAASTVGVVGVGASDVPAGDATLWGLWVAPEGRGSGAGDALLSAARQWAAEHSKATVTLWVMAANDAAIALYERNGYLPHDPTVEGIPTPEGCADERCFRLDLTG